MTAIVKRNKPRCFEWLGEQLMSAYAFFPHRLTAGKAFAPLHVVLEITYRCNLRCDMCFQGKAVKTESDPIDTEGWKRIIDQIPSRAIVTLTGGEPTLRRDFRELAEHAFKRHRCHMNTNGIRLPDGDLAEFIVNGRFMIVGVSLDGDPETHNALRNSSDAFEKAWSGIEKLIYYKRKLKSRWPIIDIKTVIFPHTLEAVSRLVDMVSKSGIDLITFSFPKISTLQFNPVLHDTLRPFYDTVKPNTEFEEMEVRRYALQWEEMLKANGVGWRYYPRMFSCQQFAHYFALKTLKERYLPCYVPWSVMSVTNSGDVYPCLSFRFGNLREQSLREIWNGSKAREFRGAIKKNVLLPQCEGCCWLRVKPAEQK